MCHVPCRLVWTVVFVLLCSCAVVSSVCLLCRLWVHALAVFNIYMERIVRPNITQSHPHPPPPAAQAEMPTPQSITADNPETGRDQLLRNKNMRLETSMPVVQRRPARAALQEEDDVTHERPSSSFHIQHPSPQMTDSSTRGQSDFGAVKVTSK